jgi:tape measure domain-containing protein
MANQEIGIKVKLDVDGESDVTDLESHLRELGGVLEGDLSQQARAAADAIQSLGEKQNAVAGFSALANEVNALGIELLEAQGAVDQLGAQMAEATTRTDAFARAELQAKAALEGKLADLDRTRAALRQMKEETTGAARSTDAYRQGTAALSADIERLSAEIGQQRNSLHDAASQARTAQQAQNALATQYEASAVALMRVRGAQQDANAALDAGRARLQALGIDAANLGQAERNLAGAIAAARQEAIQIVPAYAKVAQAAQSAAQEHQQSAKTFHEGMDSIGTQLRNIQNIAALALGGGFAAGLLRDVADTADAFNNLAARVKLSTGEGEAFAQGFAGVQQVALGTNSTLESTGTLFARILQAGKAFNLTQQAALGLTKTINQAVQLSGGSAQAADAAITQLIQGLQSGVLRGEEFNSVMEQAPRLAQALAAGLGVTTGELRKMAGQGQLTAQTVIDALQSQSEALQTEFTNLPATVGRAITNLQTQWMLFVGQLDASTGATSYVADGINVLANNLDAVARVAGLAGAALTAGLAVQGAAALRAYAAEAALAAGATNLLNASIAKVPKTVNIALAVTGFEVGYQIGEMLRDNFAIVRKFGVGLVGYFEVVVNSLRLAKEAAAAVFTSDTVDAAYDRYMQRNQQVRENIAAMMQDAEAAPQKVAAAATQAGAQLQGMGAAATAAGQQVAQAGAAGAAGLGQLRSAGADALGVLKELLEESGKPLSTNAVAGIEQQLREAKARGADLDRLLRDQLPEAIAKLSGPELAKFRQDFTQAMQQAGATGKELQTGLRLIGEQAARSLGVDVAAAGAQAGAAFRKANEDMRMLILSLPALKAAGVDTGRVVGEALSKMLDGAKNQAEIDAIRGRIEALRAELGAPLADGLLDQATAKAKALKDAAEDAKGGIGGLENAMKTLGITSDATLQATAAKFKAAYDEMVATGKASARELQEGFKKAADAATSANNGVAPAWVKAQAAARGYAVEADKAGKATAGAMQAGKAATDAVGASVRDAAEALRAMGIEADQVSDTVKALVAQGQSLAAAFQQRKDNWNRALDQSKYMNQGTTNPVDSVPTFNSREEAEAWKQKWEEQYRRQNPFSTKMGAMGSYMRDTVMAEYEAELRALDVRQAMEAARKKADAANTAGTDAGTGSAKPPGGSTGGGTGGSAGGSSSGSGASAGQQIDRVVNIYIGNGSALAVPTNATGQNSMEEAGRQFMDVLERSAWKAGVR